MKKMERVRKFSMRAIGAGLAALVLAAMARGAEPARWRVQCQIIQAGGGVRGDLSLEEGVWGQEVQEPLMRRTMTLFTEGTIEMRGEKLEVGTRGWKFAGRPLDLDGKTSMPEGLRVLTPPVAEVEDGQEVSIAIDSEQRMEFMERREDGLYVLRQSQEPAGLKLTLRPRGEEERVRLAPCVVDLKLVERRETAAGTNLTVGRPVIMARQHALDISLRPGRELGILIHPPEGQGALVIRLRVSELKGAVAGSAGGK